ncbi:MAG: hypothetical protein COS34_04325 [Lysobacterales bacterium CG02_land_8_20_14_3_00_62_12]|nr:MAG: hypothetical protein COS34_04325 [Xanthomonadales bacterium CG02_land_8_20_14_3_00_62_12]
MKQRWRRWLGGGGLVVQLVAASVSAAVVTALPAADHNAARVAFARDAVMPFVVSILVVREDYVQGRAQLGVSSGSGTIISAQGHVATNAHVTENGKRFRVVLADKRELSAHLVGVDPLSDLAVLQIDRQSAEGFHFAHFSTQSVPAVGAVVLAMGAPWGMTHSLSQGVVNNAERLMVSLFQDEADYEQQLGSNQPTARYYAWIQHDAPIAPGNSGGPLVNLDGEIVGINTRGNFFGGDMAFAIPAKVAATIVSTLIKDGSVARSFFGFGVRSLRGSGLGEGVLVSSVQQDSPAASAGLVPGDRIVAVDGLAVTVAQPEQVPGFLRELTERPIHSRLRLSVQSAAGNRELSMQSVSYPPDLGENIEVKAWGLTLTEVTPSIARARSLASDHGMMVTGVRPGKRAATAQPALQVGDVIGAIDGKAVATRADIVAIGVANGAGAAARVLAFERAGQSLLSALDGEPLPRKDPTLRELPKPWIGIDTQPITGTTSRRIQGPAEGGYRVTRVYPGPAAQAGVQVGDLVLAIDGTVVPVLAGSNDDALQQRIRDADSGAPIQLSLWRGERPLQIAVAPGAAPDSRGSIQSIDVDWLDLGVRNLGFYDRVQRRLAADSDGVVVERVEAGGLGGLAHLAAGDVILRVNDHQVHGLNEFRKLTDRHALVNGQSMSFLVLRAARTRLLFLDAGWELP